MGGGLIRRYAARCFLALGPMFFAGAILARSFRGARNPDTAFGSKISGTVVAGFAESHSMLLGLRHLPPVAVLLYLLSAWNPRFKTLGFA